MKEQTQQTIGKKLTDETHRDAIHIAVLPVICGDRELFPGTKVKFAYGTRDSVIAALYTEPGIGIVDPFLADYVKKGERFWVFIHPNTVNGMRHEWTHPEVDSYVDQSKSGSELWLIQFAERWSFDYDEMIREASASNSRGHCVTRIGHGLWSASELGDDHDKFWTHLENFTGKRFDSEHRENLVWSCSC